jgi:mevalonate kinase
MLLGEHAVLHGHPALVCAVNRRISVCLSPRQDDVVTIRSNLGELTSRLADLQVKEPFRFVTAAVLRKRNLLKTGFDLKIESEFSHQVGLGSSAAVTVATLGALAAWAGRPPQPEHLLEDGVAVIRETQGVGSGADAAASIYGGIVFYRAQPIKARKLGNTCPITVLYSGSKRPTPEVVRIVEQSRKASPMLFDAIFTLMGRSAEEAAAAIEVKNWQRAGEILSINHGLMDAIGVSTARLCEMAYALRSDPAVFGSKISGSGLGDCVIGLGRANRTDWPYEMLPLEITTAGVKLE